MHFIAHNKFCGEKSPKNSRACFSSCTVRFLRRAPVRSSLEFFDDSVDIFYVLCDAMFSNNCVYSRRRLNQLS